MRASSASFLVWLAEMARSLQALATSRWPRCSNRRETHEHCVPVSMMQVARSAGTRTARGNRGYWGTSSAMISPEA